MVSRTVLVVGAGGREHALVRALTAAPSRPEVICAPGSVGIAADARIAPVDPADHAAIVALAGQAGIELAVIGPEAPLVAGLADDLRAAGVAVVGPSREAARLEGSKAFAKEVMQAAGVPTARAVTVRSVADGLEAVDALGLPVAVKADGLAAGKGVVVARSRADVETALRTCFEERRFGDAGDLVVVEEGLHGREVSLLALSDGRAVARFPAARDYKPIGDGNTGPNTGGMGSVSPVADVPDALADELVEAVHRPVVAELRRRGTPFTGVLYAGLMLTSAGPRVLEFNVRFGDPETQALLPRLDEDLADLLAATARGGLEDRPVRVRPGAAVAVVLASAGYPDAPRLGDPISGLGEAAATGVDVLHAGTTTSGGGELVTAGGRVLAVAATGPDVAAARARAYAAAERIEFAGRQMRRDIAAGLE